MQFKELCFLLSTVRAWQEPQPAYDRAINVLESQFCFAAVSPLFSKSWRAFRVGDGFLVGLVRYLYKECLGDHLSLLDAYPGSDCLYLWKDPKGCDKNRRILTDDAFYGKRVAKAEYPCRNKLKEFWTKFVKHAHVQYLLSQLDVAARLMNRRAVRSSVSAIDSTTGADPQMWHRDKTPESDRNKSLRNQHGHCFSFLVSLAAQVQSLNILTGDKTKNAFQLWLPPGVVVALGPEQLHAGSSGQGVRLHICYDVEGLDSFSNSENFYDSDSDWPDWRSDKHFNKVQWHAQPLRVPIVTK
jgi:hypothetical protein